MHGAGANDDTSLNFVIYLNLHYIQTRTPKGDKSTVQSCILAHPNATCTDNSTVSTEITPTKEKVHPHMQLL